MHFISPVRNLVCVPWDNGTRWDVLSTCHVCDQTTRRFKKQEAAVCGSRLMKLCAPFSLSPFCCDATRNTLSDSHCVNLYIYGNKFIVVVFIFKIICYLNLMLSPLLTSCRDPENFINTHHVSPQANTRQTVTLTVGDGFVRTRMQRHLSLKAKQQWVTGSWL